MIISGPITSTLLCMFFALMILLTDSIHLLFPVVESKRSHTSMMLKLFGPATGIRDMDKVVGYTVTIWMGTLLAGIWHKQQKWSLVCVTILATAQPYYVMVAYYTKAFGLKAPMLPVVYSAIFGLVGLLWREVSHDVSFFKAYWIPIVSTWHFFMSFLILVYICRIRSRIGGLTATLELEKLKADAVKNGECIWKNACDMPKFPEGFEPYPILVESAEKEQSEIIYGQALHFIIAFMLILSAYVYGVVQSDYYYYKITEDYINICLVYVTLPLVLLELVLITIYCLRSTSVKVEMFDDIEGARSFQQD